jgi:hypothetical protein|tara:strand:+ start:291 stop:479 length:189 start_codon:yes stop_codon:yes gene_type:complete
VCSFLDFTCAPPVEYPKKFNNWYECMLKAHEESVNLLIKLPQDVVEKNRLATKYTCELLTDV